MKTHTLLFLLMILQTTNLTEQDNNSWELKKEDDGISVYTREVEGSAFKELKINFNVKTTLSAIIALFKDVPSYPDWVYKCKESDRKSVV